MIVFDSSPLISLTQIKKIKKVIGLFRKLYIPKAVYEEVVKKGIEKGIKNAWEINEYIEQNKIEVIEVKTPEVFMNILHPGEREAIILAEEKNAMLIIDERKGRIIAKQRNILIHGTLGILLILLKENIIDKNHYINNLKLYASEGWISVKLYEKFKKEANLNE